MTDYKIAPGLNNAAGLVLIPTIHQPRTPSDIVYELRRTVTGAIVRAGFGTVDLEFTAFPSYSALTTFLDTYFNFTITNGEIVEDHVLVTFSSRGHDGSTYRNYNATAELVKPLQRRTGRFEPVTIRLTRMVAI